MKRANLIIFGLIATMITISSCNKDDEANPNGFVDGTIVEANTLVGLEGVLVTVFDSNTNQPVISVQSGVEGKFNIEILPGSYYVRLNKQNYQDVPPVNISPVPFNVVQGSTELVSNEMSPLNNVSYGWITGKVQEGSTGTPGTLVIAESAGDAFSAYSDQDGNFSIFNVKPGNYQVKGWISGFNSDQASAEVVTSLATEGVTLSLSSDASGIFMGQIKNLATENKDVDIALVHTITKQVIPGLTTFSNSQNFDINNIPNGTFIARATFENDQRVMDPDRIAKFGEPVITINNNTEEISFDITNSVSLNSPTNSNDKVIPVEISTTTPSFDWQAYSSSSDYVIEVSDVNGNIIWGGFSQSNGLPVKNVTIPSGQLSAEFNFDGSATIAQLVDGQIYRWRIYASKDDQNSSTGWVLISASEDQKGIFRIME